jgi:hypothetical protein
MADNGGKLEAGNFMQALESIRREAERLTTRRDLPLDVRAALDRIIALTEAKFDLGGDTE